MSALALQIENVSKVYRVGTLTERPRTLFGGLASTLKAPLQSYRQLRSLSRFDDPDADDVLWALRDVSFDVAHGDVVGLIGRNGAGKSTLLKVLSRITEPTRGRIKAYGRIASLLEVGTGFHDDLTGRENVYLNGAILGMTKAEIDRKFDEIVAFSEIERFIDTMTKRYSSGMKVRLAFAVAAHLEPEILLVDEVLAVGDVAFQKKCLGKMDDVAGEGRTVVFVSHHMSMIQALCRRGVVMNRGEVEFDGGTDQAIARYLRVMEETAADPFGDNPERSGNGRARLTAVRLRNREGDPTTSLVAGQPCTVEFDYESRDAARANITFTIYSDLGSPITSVNLDLTQFEGRSLGSSGTFACRIPNLPLPPARYRVAAMLSVDGEKADHVPAAVCFDVASSVFFASGKTPSSRYSLVMIDHEWSHETGLLEASPLPA